MPFALALSDARLDLTNLAGIDGQVTTSGRHTPTNLNRLLNRKYRNLRSRVSQLGLPQFLQSTAALPIPAQTAGEDWIEVPMTALSAEVVGVDVRVGNGWSKLDPLEFEQRRDPILQDGNRGLPFYLRGREAPSGVGWWMVNKAPTTSQATTIIAGSIALFPPSLGGTYKLHSVEAWADIVSDTHVFMLYEGWDEWFLNAAAMTITQRDTNKKDNYAAARDAWAAADALIVESAARLQRGGFAVPSSYGGLSL